MESRQRLIVFPLPDDRKEIVSNGRFSLMGFLPHKYNPHKKSDKKKGRL
jgi:hypothetical protein